MPLSSPVTLQYCIDEGERLFTDDSLYFGHGTDNAADEALWLALFALDLDWNIDQSALDQPLSDEQHKTIHALFQRRIDERIPAAYITGEAWFLGLPFIVNEHVLVPRSPLAECVAYEFSPYLDDIEQPAILDLCTGSGCIGIASAMALPGSAVVLSDISTDAINVARRNIDKHQLGDRVTAIESDLFEALHGRRFDLIVTNPPYVDAEDFASRPPEYRAEPDIALESGVDGLDFTRRLLREAADYLTENGHLIVELGNSGEHCEVAFPNVPFLWLEFEHGGHGVFVLSRKELIAHKAVFA